MSDVTERNPVNTIGEAFHAMVITGILTYGPKAVGIVLCGVPSLGLAALGYLVLGSIPVAIISGVSGLGVGGAALVKSRSGDGT